MEVIFGAKCSRFLDGFEPEQMFTFGASKIVIAIYSSSLLLPASPETFRFTVIPHQEYCEIESKLCCVLYVLYRRAGKREDFSEEALISLTNYVKDLIWLLDQVSVPVPVQCNHHLLVLHCWYHLVGTIPTL